MVLPYKVISYVVCFAWVEWAVLVHGARGNIAFLLNKDVYRCIN